MTAYVVYHELAAEQPYYVRKLTVNVNSAGLSDFIIIQSRTYEGLTPFLEQYKNDGFTEVEPKEQTARPGTTIISILV